jgi:hypothetical protein
MKISDKPKLLPRFPTGWYALCLARDLQSGEMKEGRMGRDLTAFQTCLTTRHHTRRPC